MHYQITSVGRPGYKWIRQTGAVVKGQPDKGRWTKGRWWHKVDRALIRHKADDKRPTGLATMTKGRRRKVDRALIRKKVFDIRSTGL